MAGKILKPNEGPITNGKTQESPAAKNNEKSSISVNKNNIMKK